MRLCGFFVLNLILHATITSGQCNYNDTPDLEASNLTDCELNEDLTVFNGNLHVRSDIIDILSISPEAGTEIYEIEIEGSVNVSSIFPPVGITLSKRGTVYSLSNNQRKLIIPLNPAITGSRTITLEVPFCPEVTCRTINVDWEIKVRTRPIPMIVDIDEPDLPSTCSERRYKLEHKLTEFHGHVSTFDTGDEWHIELGDNYEIDSIVVVTSSVASITEEIEVKVGQRRFVFNALGSNNIWDDYPIYNRFVRFSIESMNETVDYKLIVHANLIDLSYCSNASCNIDDSPDFPEDPGIHTCCVGSGGQNHFSGTLVPAIGDSIDAWTLAVPKDSELDFLKLTVTGINGFASLSQKVGIATVTAFVEIPGELYFPISLARYNFGTLEVKVESRNTDVLWQVDVISHDEHFNEWLGQSTDWNYSRNWSNSIPTINKDIHVEENNSIFFPIVLECGRARTLEIDKGARLDVYGEMIIVPK